MQTQEAVLKKKTARSRVTNGNKLLMGVDERNPWVRRCKDIIAQHIGDLGGAENVTAAEHSIIRRAAVLTTELERFEVKFASTGEASATYLDLYGRTASNLRRLLESVGLQRRPRLIATSVSEYLANRDADVIDQTNESSDGNPA
jgi:hypothetical protein